MDFSEKAATLEYELALQILLMGGSMPQTEARLQPAWR
jgi:hypothetical protein